VAGRAGGFSLLGYAAAAVRHETEPQNSTPVCVWWSSWAAIALSYCTTLLPNSTMCPCHGKTLASFPHDEEAAVGFEEHETSYLEC